MNMVCTTGTFKDRWIFRDQNRVIHVAEVCPSLRFAFFNQVGNVAEDLFVLT